MSADEWQAKRDAKLAELKRLRRGDADDAADETLVGPDDQLTQAILALAQAVFHARTSKEPLPPDVAELLA